MRDRYGVVVRVRVCVVWEGGGEGGKLLGAVLVLTYLVTDNRLFWSHQGLMGLIRRATL